ncbi:MAG TPA: J domain-containing protein [Sphingomicrobium sp.]|nr:J domain-containing protein [Sphingomicrobium sp.]
MGGNSSAYAALGLEPGADAQAVDRAYKKLIKQYHPDREGGDPRRAAEINRAYRDLRAQRPKEELEFFHHPDERSRRRGWIIAGLALAVGLGAGLIIAGPAGQLWPASVPIVGGAAAAAAAAPDPIDQPLNLSVIDDAAREAVRISRSQDEMALATVSRDCHRQLRDDPTIVQLDRCAAFDDAVVQLQDRDPLRDQGPFSELAVTGRSWSGASMLTDDYLAIDGRLDRIRLRVELDLAPAIQPTA